MNSTYRKEPMTMTSVAVQHEYVMSLERGYGFTNHGRYCHYLFREDQIDPGLRTMLRKKLNPVPGAWYIWSLKDHTLTDAAPSTNDNLRITAIPGSEVLNWTTQVDAITAAWEAE